MTRNQLNYFLEVYKLKSVKQAAEKLMISTQGVSKIIVGLEKELGIQLFERVGSQLVPTRAGDELFPHACRIISEFHVIEETDVLRRQPLVVYSIDGILEYFAAGFLQSFHKTYPDIMLKIIEVPNQSAINHVKKGDGEIALLQSAYNVPGFESHFLFSCRFCMVVNKQNPLSKKNVIRDKDWDGQMIAGRGFEYVVFNNKIKSLNRQGYHPIVCMESNNERLLLSMAEANLALACVSEQAALENLTEHVSISILEDKHTHDEVHIMHQSAPPLSPAAVLFMEYLFAWCTANNAKAQGY